MAREADPPRAELPQRSESADGRPRLILYLGTDSAKLAQAIDTHRAYIAAETLVASAEQRSR